MLQLQLLETWLAFLSQEQFLVLATTCSSDVSS